MTKIFTAAALHNMRLSELRALHAELQRELNRSDKNSSHRSQTLASLEQVSQAIASSYRNSSPSP